MKRLFIFLGFAVVLTTSSCTKKAADAIVGHWEVTDVMGYYDYTDIQQHAIFEFESDGTLRFDLDGEVCEGVYGVKGSNILLNYAYGYGSWIITQMSDDRMRWIKGETSVSFSRTNRSVGDTDNDRYFVSALPEPFYGGEVTGTGYYYCYNRCTLTAEASPGYVFVNWTEDGCEVSTGSTYSFEVFSNRYLVANFRNLDDYYFVDATSNPIEGGSIYGEGIYYVCDYCSLTAVANPGYVFTCWTEDGHVVSTESSYSFNVFSNRHLVANFELVYTPSPYIQFEWDGYVFQYGETVECSNYQYDIDEFIQHMQIRNNSNEEKRIVIEKKSCRTTMG